MGVLARPDPHVYERASKVMEASRLVGDKESWIGELYRAG
jgi:hypothetical protein